MWSTIGGTVLKVVTDQFLNNNKPYETQGGNYNVKGHINNWPIDVALERAAHGSGAHKTSAPSSTTSYSSRDPWLSHETTARSPNNMPTRTSQNTSKCQNCDKTCNNTNNAMKRDIASRKQRDSDKFCMIRMPDNGNFEIKIKKTEAQFASMNIKAPRGPPSNQKKFDNNQRHQNGNFKNQPSFPKGSNSGKNNLGGQKKDMGTNKFNPAQNKTSVQNRGPKGNNGNSNQKQGQSTWMYLGRLKKETTVAEIRSYLNAKFPLYDFRIEPLPLYKDGKLPSFKVRVDNCILDEFQDLSHWPTGVKITKYINNFKN